MNGIRRSEAQVLRLVTALFTQRGEVIGHRILAEPHKIGKGMGKTATGLLAQHLRAGSAALLLRNNWTSRVSFSGEEPVMGPIWCRQTDPGLIFSRTSWILVRWLVSQAVPTPKIQLVLPTPQTGDMLLGALVADMLLTLSMPVPAALRAWPLVRLSCPEITSRKKLTFTELTTGVGAQLVTALQPWLATRWVSAERSKSELITMEGHVALGDNQWAVLTAWFEAIEQVGRRDLATFVIDAAYSILQPHPIAAWWIHALRGTRITERVEARRAASRFLASLRRLSGWHEEHRAARFIDDGYDAAQALLSAWADFGAGEFRGFRQAAALVEQMTALEGT